MRESNWKGPDDTPYIELSDKTRVQFKGDIQYKVLYPRGLGKASGVVIPELQLTIRTDYHEDKLSIFEAVGDLGLRFDLHLRKIIFNDCVITGMDNQKGTSSWINIICKSITENGKTYGQRI